AARTSQPSGDSAGTGTVQSSSLLDPHPVGQQPSPFVQVTIGVQLEGAPVHVKQVSTWHALLQPSPDVALPSSHDSPGSIVPLPQVQAGPMNPPRPKGASPTGTLPRTPRVAVSTRTTSSVASEATSTLQASAPPATPQW